MTTLVPIVVLVDKDAQPALVRHVETMWANLADEQRDLFTAIMGRNGWTRDMVVLGSLLTQALKVNAAIERLSVPT